MNHDALHILLADDDDDDRLFFKDAIEEVKVKTVVTMVNDGVELMDYLIKSEATINSKIFPLQFILLQHWKKILKKLLLRELIFILRSPMTLKT